MLDGLLSGLRSFLPDILSSALEKILQATVYKLFYYIASGLCSIVGVLDQMFQVFAGLTKVSYNGEPYYLINVFFANTAVNNVYWGMALIGIALSFGFAIFAVVRKMFDLSGRIQQSLGQTLTTLFRSILLIVSLTAIMTIVLNSTGTLMQQVNYVFSDAYNLDLPETIVYTEEQYAAMGRVLNTIGNYSLNPSYSSRYNINTCYNEIRADLYYLQQQNVFRYYYTDTDANGDRANSWQSVLQKIANASDLRRDLKLDVAYESVTSSILNAMNVMRTDGSFRPLSEYTRVVPDETLVPMDRMIFLMGAMHAAKNSTYNERPGLDDPVRGPYYSGEKSIYDLGSINSDFNISPAYMDYIILYVSAIAVIFDLVIIILNCIARIFNMLFLYVIAPPIFASAPLDNGSRTRQWMTAFTIQSLSVFATVISMRLLLIYLPIVASPNLVLFDNVTMNLMAKLLLVYGGFETAKKATGMLTGILAENAGMQAMQAGDMSAQAGGLVRGTAALGAGAAVLGTRAGIATGKVAGKAALTVGKPLAKGALKAAGFLARPLGNLGGRAYRATLKKPVDAVKRFGGSVAGGFRRFGNWWSGLGSGGGSGGGGGKSGLKSPPPLPDSLKSTLGSSGPGGGSGPNSGSGSAGLPGSQSGSGSGGLPGSQGGSGSGGLPGNQSGSASVSGASNSGGAGGARQSQDDSGVRPSAPQLSLSGSGGARPRSGAVTGRNAPRSTGGAGGIASPQGSRDDSGLRPSAPSLDSLSSNSGSSGGAPQTRPRSNAVTSRNALREGRDPGGVGSPNVPTDAQGAANQTGAQSVPQNQNQSVDQGENRNGGASNASSQQSAEAKSAAQFQHLFGISKAGYEAGRADRVGGAPQTRPRSNTVTSRNVPRESRDPGGVGVRNQPGAQSMPQNQDQSVNQGENRNGGGAYGAQRARNQTGAQSVPKNQNQSVNQGENRNGGGVSGARSARDQTGPQSVPKNQSRGPAKDDSEIRPRAPGLNDLSSVDTVNSAQARSDASNAGPQQSAEAKSAAQFQQVFGVSKAGYEAGRADRTGGAPQTRPRSNTVTSRNVPRESRDPGGPGATNVPTGVQGAVNQTGAQSLPKNESQSVDQGESRNNGGASSKDAPESSGRSSDDQQRSPADKRRSPDDKRRSADHKADEKKAPSELPRSQSVGADAARMGTVEARTGAVESRVSAMEAKLDQQSTSGIQAQSPNRNADVQPAQTAQTVPPKAPPVRTGTGGATVPQEPESVGGPPRRSGNARKEQASPDLPESMRAQMESAEEASDGMGPDQKVPPPPREGPDG